MNREIFEVGKQPCDNFNPSDSCYPGGGNLHECPGCCGCRSWCQNCNKDHHSEGWDLCGSNTKHALRAIVARIKGEFDNPELMLFGPLSTDTVKDILNIALSAE